MDRAFALGRLKISFNRDRPAGRLHAALYLNNPQHSLFYLIILCVRSDGEFILTDLLYIVPTIGIGRYVQPRFSPDGKTIMYLFMLAG